VRLRTSASSRQRHAPGRLAVTRAEAARALGVSINSFERHMQPELKIVRRRKLRLIPVREIELTDREYGLHEVGEAIGRAEAKQVARPAVVPA
jgi:hypothetical protein